MADIILLDQHLFMEEWRLEACEVLKGSVDISLKVKYKKKRENRG